jgi:putative sugar O-methyltransferase
MKLSDEELIKILKFHNNKNNIKKISKLDRKWKELNKEINKNFKKKNIFDLIKSFRSNNIFFINDLYPTTHFSNLKLSDLIKNFSIINCINFIKEILPSSVMQRKLLSKIIETLEQLNCSNLLLKNDISLSPGKPFYYSYKKYKFNMRWLRYIYFLKLFNEKLKKKLKKKHNIFLDIGCGYGAFSTLLKKELPNTTHILVDFPNQLSLAYYYLRKTNYNYKIATLNDFKFNKIEKSNIKKYDFVLIPNNFFDKIKLLNVDLITNFFSFGEMKKKEMKKYLDSPIIKNSKFIFICNRIFSNPNPSIHKSNNYDKNTSGYYDNDTTIQDYQLHNYKKIFFDQNPVYPYLIKNLYFLFYKKVNLSSNYFDFIGAKK